MMTEREGFVAVESQLFSVAQRHLQVLFGVAHITRGDGCVLFDLPPLEEGDEEVGGRMADEMQRLCTTLVREVTGDTKVRLHGEDNETDFASLKTCTKKFSDFMAEFATLDVTHAALQSLPSQPNVQHMLEMLYTDVVADIAKILIVVNSFPTIMCPTGARMDLILDKSVCIQFYSKTENSPDLGMNTTAPNGNASAARQEPSQGPFMKVRIDLRVLANAIASYSTTSIANELPTQWCQKAFTLPEAPEVLKLVHKALSSYWGRNPHNEHTKMNVMSLLSIVSGDLREYIKGQILAEGSDWRGPWRMDLDHLEKALEMIEKWNAITHALKQAKWVDWDVGDFRDEVLHNFAGRLQDVVKIRKLLESTSKLMQGRLPDSIAPEVVFEEENLTNWKKMSKERWAKCMAKFEGEFSFIEDNLRGRVKQLFSSQQQDLDGSIRLLQQHAVLLQREGIRSSIKKDLGVVRDMLIQKVKAVLARYENNKRRATTDTQMLRISKSCQVECAQVPESAIQLFGMSEELDAVVEATRGVIQVAQKDEEEVLMSWKQNMEAQCKKIVSVSDAVSIRGVDKNYLVCTINSSIKQFLQEISYARSWCGGQNNRGRLSEEAERTVECCERFLKAATRSMQIVSNYNTVRRQILHCTLPMLEELSEHAVGQILYMGNNTLTFPVSSYHELEGLNLRFQNAVEALSSDNRRIRRFHCEFISQVSVLHNVELARHTEQWRSAVDGLRRSFDEFLHTHSFTHYDTWRSHLDAQIYKALEHQYQRSLESLHEKMQEFNVELVFKQGQIHFRPSFEAMREAYYVHLRDLVSIPLRFRGLQEKRESGGSYKMYSVMPLTNKSRLVTVHLKAVELFMKLNRVRKAFRTHVAVGACGINGAPDIDTLVDAMCQTLQQFVDGFGVVKEQMRKLQDMEDNIKVDCFTISTIPVKASIEDQLHRLEESLVKMMRKKMQKVLMDVDNFVFNASNIITRQPTTMDEMGQANKAYYEFFDTMPLYEAMLTEVEKMNTVLRQQSGATIDLSGTKSRWAHLHEAMASHHKVIDASVAKMRVSLEGMIQKHMKSGYRFASKWEKQKKHLFASFKDCKVDQIRASLAELEFHLSELEELETQGRDLESKCEYFKLPGPNFTHIKAALKDAAHVSEMKALFDNFNKSIEELRKEDWLTFRSHTYLFDDFIKEWRDKLSAQMKNEVQNGENEVITQYLQTLLDEWSNCVPLLRFVRGEGMMTEHWNEMFRLLEIEKGMKSAELTFGHILDHHKQVVARESELKQLHARVQGEVQIREALQDLRAWALEATFKLVTPTDVEVPVKVKLITDWKDTLTQVSDNQALINSLKDSPFFVHFSDEVGGWEVKLAVLFEALTLMNTIQRKWTYLEPIFARGALPQEQARFKRVDKEFVSIFRELEADPRVMTVGSQTDIVDRLKGILEQMEQCQKSLVDFLETKRENFPRFYFISDEDMLEILGHSKNPSVIQTHLKKLFMGIHSVLFSDDNKAITHMVSVDKETVPLIHPVSIEDDDVEKWLVRLDECMRETLQKLLLACVRTGDPTEKEVIEVYPSQILQVAIQLRFSSLVEEIIKGGKILSSLDATLKNSLNRLTLMSSDVDHVTMLKVKALVLDIIHQIEIVEVLVSNNVKSVESWWWQKQLRYYITDEKKCIVAMMDTRFDYTYEYQGNAAKLVHTPLTDKCYLVLTKGMQLGYGGNPYGPAGTGKTESVKALGTAMGRQVLVFNCDEGIDFKAMGRIFIGIVKCGAWGCFDEFNRLKIDQLSAISQMIQVIQGAIKNREPTCPLLDRVVQVNKNAGIFVTLNPAGKGYGGRTKLPDNLKQLFREVAMSVPDNELITSTMLLSEGFTHAKSLSKKVVELYRLSGQLMSRQQHYDWGLRSLKAVLRLAGTLVQKWKLAHEGKNAEEEEEAELILQSLNINMLSKLTFEDARLFKGLTADIFPKVIAQEITYEELESAIKVALQELNLQFIPAQVQRVLQLYEAMNQRMGVVLVGPSGSGKSTLLHILRKALQVLHIEVPLHVMNPKAVPRRRLLGYMDPDTREWYDGVLSSAAREVIKQVKECRPWILCDGDIDPEWIESLNSVLDDNKLLTLPNGVRIQFGDNVNFFFETHTLAYASPATVSRMGVIFLSENDVTIDCVVASFLQKQTVACRNLITPLISKYLIPAVEKLCKSDGLVVSTTRIGALNCCLSHVLHSVNEEDFVFSLARGISGMLWPKSAQSITSALYEKSNLNPLSSKRPYDTYYNREKGQLAEFKADLHVDISTASLLNGGVVIQTVDMQRLLATLEPLVTDDRFHPLFLVGPEGCGKSIALQQCFANRSGARITVLHCSAQTTSLHLIQKLEQLCTLSSSNNGHVYRPKESERLVVILKNVNLPKPDKYGTVELHAFLLQLFMYHGFYNNDLEWVGVEKVQFVASMSSTVSAGRYTVTPRLLAIVGIVFMPYPSHAGLVQIYSAYFSSLLKSVNVGVESSFEKSAGLANFAVNVFEKISHRFDGEENPHCLFSPRNITNLVTNILMYTIDPQVATLPAILSHEAICIFADCLSRPEDHLRAEKIISEVLATIGYSSASTTTSSSAAKTEKTSPIMFVSWLSEADECGVKPLKGVPYETVVAEIERGLLKYSREFKALNIHVIPEVVAWITRVDRVLARRFGHLILVGQPGAGRRDAVFLAAYMLRMEVVTLNMMQEYGVKNFRQDLRQFVQRATTQNERMVLLLEDHNITDESFLELINSLVSSGEVPGLFTPEELETMFSSMREEAASDGYIGTIYSYFLMRLRRNLRVALIMDNRHSLFLVRMQSNPGLLSSCDLLWVGTWSSSATRYICKKRLHGVIQQIEESPVNKGFHLHREMFAVHETFGNESTPGRFQVFMDTYEALVQKKNEGSESDLKRLETGLMKLHEAEASVEKIQHDVTKKKEQVEMMQRGADRALAKIQKKMEESKEQRDGASELQMRLKDEQGEIVLKRQKVEDELGGIKPSLEAAREAVSSIRSEQLNEIRSLKAPPEPVRDVLEGVLALLGVTDVSWLSMRKFLGERGAKERILEFDARKVTPVIRENVARLLHQKAISFKPEVIHRASVAAAPMAAWVQAMVDYSTILDRIAPLTQQLQQLEANQKRGEEQLHALKKKLKHIDEAVEELRREFSEKCKEAERLKDTFEKAEEELRKACDLLEKLSSEKTRWAQDAERIRTSNSMMPKRALVAAAFMTYITREAEDARKRYLKQWSDRLNLPAVVSVTGFMRDESDLLQWKAEGLPGDELSQENAITILDGLQTPLVIDPANQAIEWVKAHLRNNKIVMEVVSVHDERFTHTLELAVRFGKTLLVVDVNGVPPILYPVVRRDLLSSGAKRVVQIGNKRVEWQDTFRIILFTRSTDISLSPSASALVVEVNFSVTRFGLENQLLGVTIQHERPELEQQRADLVKKEEKLKLELSKLEVQLLNDLANSCGDLLENVTLIGALNDVKMQASSITEALQESHALQVELDEKRDVYRLFASKGAMIYFLVKDLEKLNRMYHFGLNDFVGLFDDCLKMYKGSSEVEQKISELTLSFAQKCFFHVSLGLLKRDRLVFGMHLVHGLFPDEFPTPLWNVLVGVSSNKGNGGGDDGGKDAEVPIPPWAPATARTKFAAIVSDEAAAERMKVWKLHATKQWSDWMLEGAPEEVLEKDTDLNLMDRLLLINTFRPDRLSDLLQNIIMRLLKLDILMPVASLEDTVSCGTASTPIILITSCGADPSMEVQDIALRLVGKQRFTQIALGGGQTEDAILHLHRCAAQGDWLFLKNLHLVLDWATVLEKELSTMPSLSPDFRLIITTEPHDLFPTVLLRMSTKVTVEAPPGMKQNLLRFYTTWDDSFLNRKTKMESQMLFGLAWFHALLQERRNYVPQGWAKFYEFSPADLKSAADVIGSVCVKSQDSLDWTTLHGLLRECIYGGRLENPRDEEVLKKLVSNVFNDESLIACNKGLYGTNMRVPTVHKQDAILQFICDRLPDSDAPSVLCLPSNADRAVKEQVAMRLCEDLRPLTHFTEANVTAREAWRTLLAPLLEMWSNSGLMERKEYHLDSTSDNNTDPMKVFFISELELLREIIACVAVTFDELRSVVEGSFIPSAKLRMEAIELIGGRVPQRWLDQMDGPKELKLWLAYLSQRLAAIIGYARVPFSSLKAPFDLVNFLRPQTFLNALRQFTARTTSKELVRLMLVASIGSGDVAEGLSLGVTLRGESIHVQGVLIDMHGGLKLCDASSPSSAPLASNVRVGWVSEPTTRGMARIPLYTDAARTTFILDLVVPVKNAEITEQLLLGGVAAFLVSV